ncbi:hypothetical protein OQH61_00255 [Helicobacter sp. MIT 21-1697]|uniref:hypothetical protein n=1 Tax=Helicobacter sp. MIT 21-1697 TaxID=2993733 RepID=UPI00224B10AF|nr:hypothetical protein [Helicobacter sp. MIT 21-1697]MCX2716172.1 hypothetical protein [Helicobacter sp. MIT 21-1697]
MRLLKRTLLVVSIIILDVWACTGDCKSCHQNLDYKNDIRHRPMLECKTCHTDEKMAQIDMGSCGEDCFSCHDAKKIQSPSLAKEHRAINACIQCHTQLSTSPLNAGENVFQKSLKSFSNALAPTP